MAQGDHDEPTARLLDRNRRRVGRLVGKRLPTFLSRLAIESHNARFARSTNLRDHDLAFDNRMRGNPPLRHPDPVFALKIAFPKHFPGHRIEAMEMAGGAERISPAIMKRDRRARPGFVREIRIRTLVRNLPKLRSGFPVEAEHPFGRLVPSIVRNIDPSASHRRP
jgi:hypothetical protein